MSDLFSDLILILSLSVFSIAICIIFITATSIGYIAWNWYIKKKV